MLDTSEKNDETPPNEDLLQKEGRSCLERRTVLVDRQTAASQDDEQPEPKMQSQSAFSDRPQLMDGFAGTGPRTNENNLGTMMTSGAHIQ